MNQTQIAKSLRNLANLIDKKEAVVLSSGKIPHVYQKGKSYDLDFRVALNITEDECVDGYSFGDEVIFIGNDSIASQAIPNGEPVIVVASMTRKDGLISVVFEGKVYTLTADSVSKVERCDLDGRKYQKQDLESLLRMARDVEMKVYEIKYPDLFVDDSVNCHKGDKRKVLAICAFGVFAILSVALSVALIGYQALN